LRGHTFLYLTNQRVIVLELSQGTFAREQSVCHFSLEDICGFQLLAQRGLKKLFGLLLLKEMRTFYLGITTRTCMNVQIGAVNVRRSEFDPGRDAVALRRAWCKVLAERTLAANRPGEIGSCVGCLKDQVDNWNHSARAPAVAARSSTSVVAGIVLLL
jgi:hypothetical protein